MNLMASNHLRTIFVLVLFHGAASEFNNAVVRMDCRNSVYFDGNQEGFALRGYIGETKTTRTVIECLAICTSVDVCQSINFFKGKKMDNCELNSIKASKEHPLEEVETSVYMETKMTHFDLLSSVCSSEPCTNGAICKACDPITRYECVCPTGYGGASCEVELCDSNLNYASFNGSVERWVEPGTSGIYICNPGYSYANNTDGVLPRVCVNRAMIPTGPTCYAPCRSPFTPVNGKFTVTDPEMKHGTEASFSCDPKCIMVGSATTRCFDGSWETASPECKAPCVSPSAPMHGNFTVNDPDLKHNSEVSFYCDSLYTLVGSSTSRCSDGSWEEDSPECKAPCDSPPGAPMHGRVTVADNEMKHNSQASFYCDSRYTLAGSSTSRCSDGSWETQNSAECKAPCDSPPDAPMHGRVTVADSEMKHNSQASFYCDSRYTLVGSSTSRCSDGSWKTEDSPECKSPCDSIPVAPTHGSFTVNDNEMKHNSQGSFSCASLYTLVGSSTSRCSDGSWETEDSPECKAPCDRPMAPTHGSFNVNDNERKHNSQASFSCDSLYTLVGSSTSRCSDGSWETEDSPECKAPCTSPVAPTNGSFTVSDVQLKHNTEASFSCAHKYTIAGSSTSRCSDGSWDTDFPECRAPCDTPIAPTHGSFTVNDNERKHNSQASFSCDSLYTLVGSSTSRCSDGSWETDDSPECKAPCTSPVAPTNGSFTVSDVQLKHNTEASFSCALKYTIAGSSTSRCSNGSWDTDFPECRAPCTVPDEPLNGYTTTTDTDLKHGTVVTFRCNSMYTLQGTQTITCSDGIWSDYKNTQCQQI